MEDPSDVVPESLAPTSEVGSPRVQSDTLPRTFSEYLSRVQSDAHRVQVDDKRDAQWQKLFECQNEHLRALISAFKTPSSSSSTVLLPEFNPNESNVDAQAWCTTAELCLGDDPPQGSQLVIALTKALKGAASSWLSQVMYVGMTWIDFKVLFIERFSTVETQAGAFLQFLNEKPKDNENYGTFASRQVTYLLSRWKSANIEQIAVSTVLANLAQHDTRLRRLACTTDISTRQQMQKELQAYCMFKRKNEDTKPGPESKRAKVSDVKCYGCGKMGHKIFNCSQEKYGQHLQNNRRDVKKEEPRKKPVCYKCGQMGHISPQCPATQNSGGGGQVVADKQRRVNLCSKGTSQLS